MPNPSSFLEQLISQIPALQLLMGLGYGYLTLDEALALHPNIPNPRVVIVTDRINLDAQIWGTFEAGQIRA